MYAIIGMVKQSTSRLVGKGGRYENYELQIKNYEFLFAGSKTFTTFAPEVLHIILGQKKSIIFEQDKRQRLLWMQVRKRLQPIRPAYVELQSYGGRCCFIANS
jgi:hypothetical protein